MPDRVFDPVEVVRVHEDRAVQLTGRSGELALDLYAGVGLFSTALAGSIRHIVSVEMSQTAAKDLQYNLPVDGKVVNAATEQYLAELEGKGRR